MRKFDRVAIGEVLQVVRQRIRLGYGRALDPHGDYRDIATQGGSNLQPNEVIIVFQAALAGFVLDVEPIATHNAEQHVTLGERFFDDLAKIAARRDAVHVHEDAVLTELSDEVVGEPSGRFVGIVAAITDENLAHGQTWSQPGAVS